MKQLTFLVDLNVYEEALLFATAANHEAVVQTLILAGANVNAQGIMVTLKTVKLTFKIIMDLQLL